jgi:hypothetical protein
VRDGEIIDPSGVLDRERWHTCGWLSRMGLVPNRLPQDQRDKDAYTAGYEAAHRKLAAADARRKEAERNG